MLEIPEANTIAHQLEQVVAGKRITAVAAGASPHKWAWYTGDPGQYGALLLGKNITGTGCFGGRPELRVEGVVLSFCDGANIRYVAPGAARPSKHQLLLEFSDGCAVCCTLQMYGGIFCFPESLESQDLYYMAAKEKPSPLSSDFDKEYFASLLTDTTRKLSAKAFLATEQRIPGLGNGVLQDILWKAQTHPKRKMLSLSDDAFERLFHSVKSVIYQMEQSGGRDTENDLFGNAGGYRTVMCRKTLGNACPTCGATIQRMAHLGGSVYVCEACQTL